MCGSLNSSGSGFGEIMTLADAVDLMYSSLGSSGTGLLTLTTSLFFYWIFLQLLTLLTTKFSSPVWTLFLPFSQLHSNGFSHISDKYQTASVSNSSSLPSQLMYGVPQGCVLGPILFVLYTTPLSDIIANHSVNHQFFADDTQLQKSAPLCEVTNLTKELNDDIKTWKTRNRLKLNDNKTEALLLPFSSSMRPFTVSLPDSITLGSHNIPLLWFCLEPWSHSWLKPVEEAHHKNQPNCLFWAKTH